MNWKIDLIEEGPGDQRDKEDIDNLGSINVVLTSQLSLKYNFLRIRKIKDYPDI